MTDLACPFWAQQSTYLFLLVVAFGLLRTFKCLFTSSRFHKFLARFSGRRRSGTGRATPVRHLCRMPASPLPTLILVASSILTVAEACSSRSTPKPRPPAPTPRPNVTFPTYECPPAYAKWYCLNGATCFTVQIGESILYNCECADGFMGQRCEFKDVEGSYLPSRQRVMLETASIAGGATIAVFLVVILSIVLYINWQRRLKENRAQSTSTTVVDGGEIRVRVAELESQQQRRRPFASRGPSAHHSLSLAEIHRQRMQQTHQPHSAELSAQLGSGYAASHPPPLGTSTSPHHLPPIGKVRRPLCLPQHHHHYPPAEKIPLFHAPEGMTLTMKPLSATTLPTDTSYDVVDSGGGGAGETGVDIGVGLIGTPGIESRPLSRYLPS